MLILRSQRKVKLIVDNIMYFIARESNKYIICVSKINNINNYNYTIIAEYSTEEKALKVLDMLEAFVNTDYEKLQNLGYKNGKDIPITFVDFNSLHKPLDGVFRFPKDEEVKL